MTKPCESCGHETEINLGCGVAVCVTCEHHNGLARCYCGWSASGGDGHEELLEMGEVIDEE